MNKAVLSRHSSKVLGKFERPLIRMTVSYLEKKGFRVIPHTRFNIAYSSIFSDIDILAFKDGRIAVVEVKSKHDNIRKATVQLDRISDFVDYVYVATDIRVRKWPYKGTGLIVLDPRTGKAKLVSRPKLLKSHPRLSTINTFQRKCLTRTSEVIGKEPIRKSLYKFQVAQTVKSGTAPMKLRSYLKEIAICGLDCDSGCPIWHFK